MRIITKRKLQDFWQKETGAEQQLKAWYHEARQAEWLTPNDIKEKYRNASILGNNRVVFNICGNKYRLVVKVEYRIKFIYIRFVGTHREYDEIDAEAI